MALSNKNQQKHSKAFIASFISVVATLICICVPLQIEFGNQDHASVEYVLQNPINYLLNGGAQEKNHKVSDMNLENKLKQSNNNETMYTKRECVMKRSQKATVAGWREWVELHDIGVPHLETMIDTGTDITVLYASFLEHYRRDNDLWVRFCVNTLVGEECSSSICQAPVKSTEIHYASGNQNESFFVIEATIRIGGMQTKQDIVLKKQNGNQYIMRLGRRALQDLNLQVDPGRSYIHGDYSEEQQGQMHCA